MRPKVAGRAGGPYAAAKLIPETERSLVKNLSLAAILALLPLASLSEPAFAHTTLAKTSIVDDAELAKAPETFSFTLGHEASLASITLQDGTGKDVALAYTPPKTAAAMFSVPLPRLGNGAYMLSFKTIAKDGHVMTSMVHFKIKTP
jgi:copper resistance protein C